MPRNKACPLYFAPSAFAVLRLTTVFELGWRLYRKIGRLVPTQDAIDVSCDLVDTIRAIADRLAVSAIRPGPDGASSPASAILIGTFPSAIT
jgi:hypothetical protein